LLLKIKIVISQKIIELAILHAVSIHFLSEPKTILQVTTDNSPN